MPGCLPGARIAQILMTACVALAFGGPSGRADAVTARAVGPHEVFAGQPISLVLELRPSPGTLAIGSYAQRVTWDAGACAYVVDFPATGCGALSDPLVNRDDIDEGALEISAADPFNEAVSSCPLLHLDLVAADVPGAACVVTVGLDSLYEANTFRDLMPLSQAESASVAIRDARTSLRASETAAGTRLFWVAVPGASTYDVIRGRVESIVSLATTVDLGEVVCLENDSPDLETAGFEDPEFPSPGSAFFYLMRADDEDFGASSDGRPRDPASGACPA